GGRAPGAGQGGGRGSATAGWHRVPAAGAATTRFAACRRARSAGPPGKSAGFTPSSTRQQPTDSRPIGGDGRAARKTLVAIGRLPILRRRELIAGQEFCAGEVSARKIGAIEDSLEERRALEMGADQRGIAQVRSPQV